MLDLEFTKLPMREAVATTYAKFQSGEITRAKFNEQLKLWWRANHDPDVIGTIKEIFEA